jgi:hypothetical protein
VGEQIVLRLKCNLPDAIIDGLNQEFRDIVVSGKIERSTCLPEERSDETANLPRLRFHFNHRDFGRLHQLIRRINELGDHHPEVEHPEQK